MASGEIETKIVNDEGLSVPTSIKNDIDSALLTCISQYQCQHQVKILHHELENKNMIEAGRNFVSGVIRLKLTLEKEGRKFNSSVVVKVPQIGLTYDKFEDLKFYDKEKYMYQKVLPRMYEFWSCEKIWPNLYAATKSGILVFENLQESGFQLHPRHSRFNLIECKVVVKKLALFHALSLKYLEKYGHGPELDSVMANRWAHGEDYKSMFSSLFNKVRKYVLPTLSQSEADMWIRFENNYHLVVSSAYSPNSSGFNVICHGDIQSNNVLFHKDLDHNKIRCRFIDFQVSFRGSPVFDLIYLHGISVHHEVFREHRDEILEHYLQTLNDSLEKLDCSSRYSLHELESDLKKYRDFWFFVLSVLVPVIWSAPSTIKAWTDTQEKAFDAVIKSESYISCFKGWIELIK